MSDSPASAEAKPGYAEQDRQKVKVAVAWSMLGRILYAAQGLSIFVALHLIGHEVVGLYLIAYNLVDLFARCLGNGFGDSMVFFAARRDDDEESGGAELYAALATGLGVPLLASGLFVAALSFFSQELHQWLWARQPSSLVELICELCWLIPLTVLVRIPVEAAKGRLDMRWSVLVTDALIPGLNLGLVFALGWWGWGIDALVYSLLLPYLIAIPIAWYGFSQHFRLSKTLRAVFTQKWDRSVASFAGVQSLNLLLHFGLTRIDALMLAIWVAPAEVALYAALSEIVRSLNAAHSSFATAVSPLISRYRAENNTLGLQQALGDISLRIATLCFALLIAFFAFYPEAVVGIQTPWPQSPYLLWILALGSLYGALFGLTGNVLLMTGHPKVLLRNSLILMGLNLLLNWILISRFALMGAAMATSFAVLLITGLQKLQLRRLESLQIPWSVHRSTLAAAALPVLAIFCLNLQPVLDWLYQWGTAPGLAIKLGCTLAIALLYGALLLLRNGPERAWLRQRYEM